MRFQWYFWLTSLVVLVGLGFTVPKAYAAGVMIEPAFQFVTISASASTTTREITLTNQTDSPHEYLLSTVDIRQIDSVGQVAFVDKPLAESSYALASFLQIPSEVITLQPGENRKISVVINDNQSLSPGGHYGAVLAQVVSVGAMGEEVVVPMLSSVFLVHKVGGERFHINLKPVNLPAFWVTIPRSIQLLFENQGNVHVIPHGRVVISDIFGRQVAEGTLNEGSVVVMPENQRVISVNLSMRGIAIPLIPLKLVINGTAKPGELVFAQSGIVTYAPVWAGGLVVVLVVAAFVVIRYVKIKR
jgi:hypothetical protein